MTTPREEAIERAADRMAELLAGLYGPKVTLNDFEKREVARILREELPAESFTREQVEGAVKEIRDRYEVLRNSESRIVLGEIAETLLRREMDGLKYALDVLTRLTHKEQV